MTHIAASPWKIIGSSVVGTRHIKRSLPCQDAFRVWHAPGGIEVIAVADGAGSAEHADLGASAASVFAIQSLWTHFRRDVWERPNIYEAINHAFVTAHDDLARYARARLLPLSSLATTLTVVVLMSDCVAVGQTGDGLVIAVNDLSELKALTKPQGGEYANETFFLTDAGSARPRFAEVYTPVKAVAILTDGLLSIAADIEGQPYPRFFDPIFGALRNGKNNPEALESALSAFLQSARVNARTHDDKTLVLAIRVGTA